MRIYLHLTPNTEIVPFNYQQNLVGAFHKWLGKNELHDDMSSYSLSWLNNGTPRRNGLDFQNGSTFFVSAPNSDFLSKMIDGLSQGYKIRWGMEVNQVTIQRTPKFGKRQRFLAQSPILIKRKVEEERYHKFYFPKDKEANIFMTETLQQKLEKEGLTTDVKVSFDPSYNNPKIKKTIYKNIDIKGTLCPVIVEGDPRAVAFAWEVGIGNSTGIGFGALQ
jgi:CRISPR-associated endoribonuclease Cas6